MGEIERIRARYERRRASAVDVDHERYLKYNFLVGSERELRFAEVVRARFPERSSLKVLEIGAGDGHNLLLFRKLGVPWENLYTNDLVEEHAPQARYNLPGATVLSGDATELPYSRYFDIVVQATVFTSILDDGFKRRLAAKLLDLLADKGIVLWYDFKYDNPRNADVKGIGKDEIRRLFAGAASIEFHSTTLAPPVGRRVGRAYGLVNTVAPFLRSHIVAVIEAGRRPAPVAAPD